MLINRRLGASLVMLGGTAALQFNQPHATPVTHRFNADGWTPKPTSKPQAGIELLRRQSDDPSFCGYIDGIPCNSVHPQMRLVELLI